MNSEEQRIYKKIHRKSSKNLFRKLRKKLKRLVSFESAPKEYRPYLGPEASKEEVNKLKFKNTRVNLYHRPKKQSKKKHTFLSSHAAKILGWDKRSSAHGRKGRNTEIQSNIY